MIRNLVLLFSMGVFLCSCSPKPGDAGYVKWVENFDNGLRSRKELNSLVLDLQYQPSAYVWIQQNSMFNQEEFLKQKAGLDSMQYFTLDIRSKEAGDFIKAASAKPQEIEDRLYYFSYQFQDALMLQSPDGRKIPCVLYHFERSSSVNNTYTFVLGFENTPGFDKEIALTISSQLIAPSEIEINLERKPKSIFSI